MRYVRLIACEMLMNLRGAQLLQGDRGTKGCDFDAPARLIGLLPWPMSWLIVDLAHLLAETEINPVVAGARGAIAVYATMRCR